MRDPNNTTPPTPPSSTLTVSGSANAVNCFGGSTTATISASGGTSPYSGTGSPVVSSGKNSLRLSFNSATGNYTFLYSAIGAVSAAKSYVLRFSTLGTSASGTLRASLRQTGSPYATLTNTQSGSFGTTKKDHQFIFNAPTSDVNASFLIEVAENSGITYLDNIAVFETNAAGELIGSNLYPAGDFENGISTLYSWSQNNNHTTALDISSKINATIYFAVTDAAGTVRSTGISIDQPAGPLQAASTAPAIVVTGGTTTVTVSASGGTAPYSGVGNYTVGAGTYSYTVTDARGCTTTTAITVNQPSGGSGGGGALPSVSVTGNDVSCFGNSTTATVSASGGTAPYSGTGSFFVNSGIGSLKLSFKNTGTGNYTFNYWTIGSVSSTKSYSLRFSTLGSTNSGAFRVSLRQTGSPYSTISTVQTGVFGTNKTDHQFIFNTPVTTGDASFVIEIAENSGTTNLDNIAFFEATSTGDLVSQNLYPDGNFENNISRIYTWSANSNHVAEWDNNSKINATNYFTVTDASGAKRSVGFITNQPSSPLQAVATAPLITTAGGYTNVTLTATGGTPPYSDLGTLPVQAGFYEYRVTDSKGCSVIASITVAPYASTNLITSAIETSPIYCFSTNTAVAVTANGGNAPYTGTGSFVTTAGRNSLRLSCNNPVANQFIYNYYSIGAVSSAKRYALHFSTLGSTGNGVIQACLRQTSSPYSEITATETKSFGTTRVDHVFYFNNPVSTSDASFLIKLPQNSATTYIDNIAFFEVNAAGELISRNLYPEGDFEAGLSRIYMWTANSNHIAVVDNNNIINGTKYFTVTDALGAISTKGIIIRQPGMLLQAYASAPAITTPGGYTTINVTAAGGTPPYIGTGPSLPVQQGFHEFKVTDANGCSSVVGITTYTAVARTATTGSTFLSLTATSPLALEASTYPNPSTTAFNLRLNGGTTENVSITVMSFDGKVLYKTTGASNRTYNFGNHFVPGVYTVFIKQGSITKSLKVIKGQTR